MKSEIRFLVETLSSVRDYIAQQTRNRESLENLETVIATANQRIVDRYGQEVTSPYRYSYSVQLLTPRAHLRDYAQALFHVWGIKAARDFARSFGHLTRACRPATRQTEEVRPFVQRLAQLELTPNAMRYQRAIGIEIEGFSPFERHELQDALPYYCRIASDASIRPTGNTHGAEVRMLLNRSAVEPRLVRALKVLHAHEFQTNRSCGLHVHLHAAHLTTTERQAKQSAMIAWLRLLSNFVPQSRRQNDYCRLDMCTATARRNRYAAVNICTGDKLTIEVRLHSATTDLTKIMMWIRLCELLFVLPKPRPNTGQDLAALDALPLCEWDKSYWRQRYMQLNPATINHNTSTEEGE